MKDWLRLDSGANTPTYNMALDEALLENAATLGQPILRFYDWTEPCATFGYSQKITQIEAATKLRPLIRRCTGGGLVPHDGDWTYSLIFPPDHEWSGLAATESYLRTHKLLQAAFEKNGVKTELAKSCRRPKPGECFEGHELHDLLWNGKKIAGAAQRRNRCGLLIQGSIQQTGDWAHTNWQDCLSQGCPQLETLPDTRANELAEAKYSRDEYNRKR
ncbi:MAG: lipoate--protein ligase family protein [Verrucomicrobiota bacterium]|nr:lipoate--protein ligase family protein [Verrucomicrobiota bacterium]